MEVLLSDTWGAGGVSTFVETLAAGLVAGGHGVDVVVGYATSAAVDGYRPLARQVFTPPTSFGKVLLNRRYDIVHITDGDFAPPMRYPERVRRSGTGAGVVATIHRAGAVVPAGADVVAFVSEHAHVTASVSSGIVDVVANGVDVEATRSTAGHWAPDNRSGPLAVWAGRVEEDVRQKDYLGFAYAAGHLVERGWRLAVFDGSPPAPDYPIRDQLRRWFGDKVVYGNRAPKSDVMSALRDAANSGGVLLSTSRSEAAPFIPLEALALGCPVLAPAIPGFAPLIDRGLVASFDDLTSMLKQIDELSRVDRVVPDVPEEFQATQMIGSYLRLYETARSIARGSKLRRIVYSTQSTAREVVRRRTPRPRIA